ncbi:glycoside hydrolase family 3 C-terminal domain-containing protein [Mucilaginibacter sp. BJC16-A38]|uniref:glycoside hydrolase family 3 N-terminal domain-containing protein n=1 Tax=Mucilaginibacter phenanthrenivorans TaxID=1234842 RepID=UPI00215893D4|nr:glycoside hydrolase family 3 N-terminal domain-containing protein [Mucilaginibacter phenanthrenivorans]MCR8560698.1 glycoside hydrolase family 3 C-terminal domain-containing protein [Mucilaginibacter phenanthrenivorans]
MQKKNASILALLTISFCSFNNPKPPVKLPYKDAKLPIEKRVADLLSRMTVEEKIRQLDMYWGHEVANMRGHEAESMSDSAKINIGKHGIGSVHDLYPLTAAITNQIQRYALEKTRLGIPVLFIEEGLHGYEGLGSTTFPTPMALAGAWDTTIVHKAGRIAATEVRAHGVNMILGPVLCLPRDPRWGRVEETYGEDPYLAAANGVAMVKGMQGNKLSDPDAVLAEPKHFAVHGIPEAGSNMAPVNMGVREARSSFLYVFEKAVKEGGAMGMMAAYSEIDGIPCVDNHWLLTDVLRKEWGFKGFVLSDLGAIKMSLNSHRVASDPVDALAQTINAGLDMQFYDFPHPQFLTAMTTALKSKQLSLASLNRAVSDVLRVKFMLGLFDHPYIEEGLLKKVNRTDASRAVALQAAQEGISLLKNENSVLPLGPNVHKVAVIGPLAQSTYLGGYANKQGRGVAIVDALKQRAGDKLDVKFETGYSSDTSSSAQSENLQKAVNTVNGSDVAIVVLGEDINEVGEGKDRSSLDLNAQQIRLIQAVYKTGKPTVVVLFNGRPLCINWVAKKIPAIVESWFLGDMGGLAVADVLLGNVNPSGKLPMTFPRSVGQLPYYYNHKPTSRHVYVDQDTSALFPFGHGLSYTTFQYSGLNISPANIPVNGSVNVSVSIKNTGKVEGTEVVQLYLRDVISSVTTPVKSLKGFKRISLKPGESGIVNFKLDNKELMLWNRQMKEVVEPGEFKVMVGSSSEDIRARGSFYVK